VLCAWVGFGGTVLGGEAIESKTHQEIER
jgi:hypothetical protein